MPRGLGDAAPTHVIEAVRAADGDAGGAAIVKWRDFLKRMTLVSGSMSTG